MGKDFGPWVTHEWCPRCSRDTEQARWHRRTLGAAAEQGQAHRRTRCLECSTELSPAG